ncbi:hypothetical protein ACFYZE_06210 [Streptomyces sp. NPDC001796]|uniref:hypothetical protein n=1 Tax=Streptomyces sp. NPDC001796 TaxID=3364609 RepID=UPI0036B71877
MSAVLARHRLTLRVAVATAALAGALLTPAVAFAADGPSGTDTHCTATQTIPSAFGGWTVDLTNSLSAGPKAVLKDDKGKTVSTVDRAHPEDLANGLKIKNADTTSPLLLDRSQGDPAPWRTTPFPKLPKGCLNTGTGTGTGTSKHNSTGTGTTQTTTATQTKVVPTGAVAAGAEGTGGSQDTALLAGGAVLAAGGVIGLGYVVRRRRAGV